MISEPQVILPEGFDERAAFETPMKGWLDGVKVQLADGQLYQLSFIDPVRLQQDMAEYEKAGKSYFGEPGLIVLAEVSPESIEQAVRGLWRQGYFNHLKPLDVLTTCRSKHG